MNIMETLAALGATEAPRTEIEALRAKLAAREDKVGLKDNCDAIRARIAQLEASNG